MPPSRRPSNTTTEKNYGQSLVGDTELTAAGVTDSYSAYPAPSNTNRRHSELQFSTLLPVKVSITILL